MNFVCYKFKPKTITWVGQKFCNICMRTCLWRVYPVTEIVQAVILVGSIEMVGAQTRWILLQFVWDLKAIQMYVQRNLIREPTLYEFELSHYAVK